MTSRRRVCVLATAVSVMAALLGTSAGAEAAPLAGPSQTQNLTGAPAPEVASSGRYIVRVATTSSGVGSRLARVIKASGGSVVSVQESLGTVVVAVSPAGAAAIAAVPGVLAVDPDRTAKMQSLGFTASSQPGSMTNITRVTGAQTAWKAGYTGSGVDVAVIDTGVAPVTSLDDKDKVVVGPDLSFESQAANLRYLDTFGHGTAMSSIIGGREVAKGSGSAYAADADNYYGMAPDSRIISLKLGDRNGTVDVSQLIAAIDWVVHNRKTNGLNIKILNLSFGTDSKQSYVGDPLAHAAQVAWDKGIFVVASAGNDGVKSFGLANPAYNPSVFAVGAADTKGTDSFADDTVADFSQHPESTILEREPNLVAPGVKIVAAGAPGSYIDTTYPAARVGNGFVRGSGTSQAAAVVSGAAALLYQKWPSMTPGNVKELLTRTAVPLKNTSAALQGRGELNVAAAIASAPMGTSQFLKLGVTKLGDLNVSAAAVGGGTLEGSRGTFHVEMDGVVLAGERDIMASKWSSGLLALDTLLVKMWRADGTFNTKQWIGGSFVSDSTTVAGITWGGRSWAGRSWSGTSWSGRSWSGRSWSAAAWTGGAWTSADWPAVVERSGWAANEAGFAASQWSTAAWD